MNGFDTATLLCGLVFGSIGLGYFIYGRKQRRTVPFVSGLALMGLPYFIDQLWLMVVVCVLLILAPLLIKA